MPIDVTPVRNEYLNNYCANILLREQEILFIMLQTKKYCSPSEKEHMSLRGEGKTKRDKAFNSPKTNEWPTSKRRLRFYAVTVKNCRILYPV